MHPPRKRGALAVRAWGWLRRRLVRQAPLPSSPPPKLPVAGALSPPLARVCVCGGPEGYRGWGGREEAGHGRPARKGAPRTHLGAERQRDALDAQERIGLWVTDDEPPALLLGLGVARRVHPGHAGLLVLSLAGELHVHGDRVPRRNLVGVLYLKYRGGGSSP
eukprot:scaffold9685_cov109-Isochrysis_galbana.AAC.1